MAEKKLSAKEELFVEAYIRYRFNASKAYSEVYPNMKNPNVRGATLKNKLKDEIQIRVNELIGNTTEIAEKVLLELQLLAFGKEDVKNADKLKAMQLLQSQMGLQQQNIKLDTTGNFDITILSNEDGDASA